MYVAWISYAYNIWCTDCVKLDKIICDLSAPQKKRLKENSMGSYLRVTSFCHLLCRELDEGQTDGLAESFTTHLQVESVLSQEQ